MNDTRPSKDPLGAEALAELDRVSTPQPEAAQHALRMWAENGHVVLSCFDCSAQVALSDNVRPAASMREYERWHQDEMAGGAAAEEAPPEPARERMTPEDYAEAEAWAAGVNAFIAEHAPPPAAAPPEPARPEYVRTTWDTIGLAKGTIRKVLRWDDEGRPIVRAADGSHQWPRSWEPCETPEPPRPFGPPSAKSLAAVDAIVQATYEQMAADVADAAPVDEPEPAGICRAAHGDEALMDLYCTLPRGHDDHSRGGVSWAAAPAPSPDPRALVTDQASYQRGHDDGYAEGQKRGYRDGWNEGVVAAPAPVSPEPPSRNDVLAALHRVREVWLTDDTPLLTLHERLADAVVALYGAAGSPEPGDDGTQAVIDAAKAWAEADENADDALANWNAGTHTWPEAEAATNEWRAACAALRAAVRAALGEDRT